LKVSVPVRSIEEIDAEIARKDVTGKTLAIIIEAALVLASVQPVLKNPVVPLKEFDDDLQ
jgi:hypothetical protein